MEGIAANALVLHGGADHLLGTSSARMVAERMPNAEFDVVAEAGHYGIYENADMQRRIAAFLMHE
jgi:pimeloyl-ACP methyl ester carboxylesterase